MRAQGACMRAQGACMRTQPQTWVHRLLSKGPKLHVLGPKASLFDEGWPLDPLERSKP